MARQSRAPTLLLTRPAAQSQRFAVEVRAALGSLPIVISPLMRAEDVHPTLPDLPFRAVILTSETGAEAAGRLAGNHPLPSLAYCVGERTAKAARQAGFDARSAKGDALALIALIQAEKPEGPLLHLRGEVSAGEIAKTLTKGGIETHSAVIYAQSPCPLSAEAVALFHEDGPIVIPIFSPRSATLLANGLPATPRAPLWVAAISPAAAAAATALGPARIVTAAAPDSGNMLHAVAALLSAAAIA